jgi:hypothetical protein
LKKVLSCLPSYTWVFSQLKHQSDLNVLSTSLSNMNIVQVQELCCTTKKIYIDLMMIVLVIHSLNFIIWMATSGLVFSVGLVWYRAPFHLTRTSQWFGPPR